MKRTRATRPAFDRLTLSSVLALPRPSRGAGAPARAARPARALSALAVLAGALVRAILARRRLRISLLVAVVCVPLAIGGWRWLRSSSLVSVDHVQVTGVHGPEAKQIENALIAAGKRMTTLQVSQSALSAAVAPFHVVRSIRVATSFPHSMRIRVTEQLPVATLAVAGAQSAVAADGAVLGPALVSRKLPTISAAYEPAPGGVVHDASIRGELEILSAAPRPLVPFLSRAFEGPRGLTVAMSNGLQIFFGDSTRAHAKWIALALVLADTASTHVSAVDVRTPERPAAAFPTGYAPSTAAATTGEGASASAGRSSESIATALASGLAASAGYHSSAEAQEANAAKAAEALSPNHPTSESESGSSSGASGSASGGGSSTTPAEGG